jgi:glycerophosphoryl diester phosphodiesterase
MGMLKFLFLAAQIMVISHRGEHLVHPENTLPAFQAAIDAHADFFELDVRTTSDGQLVLMHDGTVDRTTNGHGAVNQMTFSEIRALDAGAKSGPQFAGTKVPTFEDALNLAHGKIGVYVDCKMIAPEALVATLEKTDMSDKVVIYGGAFFLKKVSDLKPSLKVMPEADDAPTLTKLIDFLKLQVVAFDAHDFKDDVINVAKQGKVLIYVDRLWLDDNSGQWQDAVDRGAAGIQTDHPAELVEFLKAKGLHK